MSAYSWREVLVESQADGAALTNTVTATSLLPTAAGFVLPANFFSRPGKKLIVRAGFRLSNVVTATPTITFTVVLGGITVFTSGALPTVATASTNLTGRLEFELDARTIGSGTTATLLGIGEVKCLALNPGTQLVPASAPAFGTGFDSTTAGKLDLLGTWSAASASNSITVHQYSVESVN